MPLINYPIATDLFLVQSKLPKKKAAKQAESPAMNHIFVIDCSGSMYSDLPQVREQIKKKLPKLMGERDTLSVIWFSGRGQFGTLLEGEPLATLTDLSAVNKALDRWLRPVGLTGFKEPLEEAGRVVERLQAARPQSQCNLLFMSDGWDNQWPKSEILQALQTATGKIASTTIVEYGYYADRQMLATMATKAGGTHVFAENFPNYDPTVEAFINRKPAKTRVDVEIAGEAVEDLAFVLKEGDIISYEPENGFVAVPSDVEEVWYLSRKAHGKTSIAKISDPLYAAISLLALRMKPDLVYQILRLLGDVRFIKQFSGCFGKQKYSAFMLDAQKAAFDSGLQCLDGYDPDAVPANDAFTILDLLEILSEDEGNKVLIDHPDFEYSRVSRARIDADEKLSPEEAKELEELGQKISTTKKPAELRDIQKRLGDLLAKKQPALKFVAARNPEGYSISNLVWNEERPNVSIQIQKAGTVDLGDRMTDEMRSASVPQAFPTYVFRNYTIIRDGLVNVEKLPISVTKTTLKTLKGKCPAEAMQVSNVNETTVILFDLMAIPIINRNMISEVSAEALFRKQWALQLSKAEQKVYNSIRKENAPKTSKGFEVEYGPEVTAQLRELGLTDYSGFSPKQVQAEASDVYIGKALKVKIKGYATLPSLNDVRKKLASGKALTSGALLMEESAKTAEAFFNSDIYKKSKNPSAILTSWLDTQAEGSRADTRRLILELAKIKFAVTVGQVWFREFRSLEENSLDLDVNIGKPVHFEVSQEEVEIKI